MNHITKYIVCLCFITGVYTPVFAEYLFISSVPIGSKVSILVPQDTKKGFKTKYIGKTPLKLTNFTESTKITIEQQGYFSVTNTIAPTTKVQNFSYNLAPLSFDLSIYNQPNSTFTVNKTTYNSLDGVLALPYGYYNFSPDQKDGHLNIAYKSPYTPYVAFFSTVTILSTIVAITGGLLAQRYNKEYQSYTNADDLFVGVQKVATWDTVTWSSVGIGTGALIGTIISGALETKAQKRIKRFNGLNKSTEEMDHLSDFEEIVYLTSLNSPKAIKKMNAFIKKYPTSLLLPDIYLKRAGLYILKDNQLRRAISDLNLIINKYPTKDNYEVANKMLGDIYLELKKYKQANEAYRETLKVLKVFSIADIKLSVLEYLYYQAKSNTKHIEEFLQESSNLKGFDAKDKQKVKEWRSEFNK